jgi:hypothetical protein
MRLDEIGPVLFVAVACALAGCGGSGSASARELTFQVTVPAGTTGTVFVTGNLAVLGEWQDGGGVPLTDAGGNRWSGTVEVGRDATQVEYKYTRGSWATVEKGSDCSELPNRQVAITGAKTATTDTVLAWRDSCQ